MSDHESIRPAGTGSSAGEQIPHSGVGGYESPVNEFDNTSLQDAVDKGLLETPESPAPLVVGESTQTTPSRLGMKIGAGAALLAIGAGAALGFNKLTSGNGDSDPTAPNTKPVATASVDPTPAPTPTEAPSSTTETEAPAVIDNAYVENYVNRDPSPEVIAWALEPVSAKDFTAEEAVKRLMNDYNIFLISGKSAWLGGGDYSETAESTALQRRLADNIFGDISERTQDLDRLPLDWMTDNRGLLAMDLEMTADTGYEEDSWFNSTTDVIKSLGKSDGAVSETFRIRETWQSNLQELDPTFSEDITAPLGVVDRTVTVRVADGKWILSEYKDFNVIKQQKLDVYGE